MQPIERVVALWKAGLITSGTVVAWADHEILRCESPSQELLDLSVEGPDRFVRQPEFDFSAGRVTLPYATEFALRASAVQLTSDEPVLSFCRWCARFAMGEDLQLPAVAFGYQVEHLLYDCDDPQAAVQYARIEFPKLLPGLAALVAPFFEVLPNDQG
jgi:hypothetical protein